MRYHYTYKQIVAATDQFLLDVERKYSNARISEDTQICLNRIKTWRLRNNVVADSFPDNRHCLQYISNLTYGVSEDVWNRWLITIDDRMDEIKTVVLYRIISEQSLRKSQMRLMRQSIQREVLMLR